MNKRKRKKRTGKNAKNGIQDQRRQLKKKKRKSHAEEVDLGLEKNGIGPNDVSEKKNVNIGNVNENGKRKNGRGNLILLDDVVIHSNSGLD